MSDKELKQIFQEIAQECHEHERCRGCKFYMKDECILNGYPDSWKLYKFKTDKWYLLYGWLVHLRAANAGMSTTELGAARMVRRHLLDEILEHMNQLDEEEDDET